MPLGDASDDRLRLLLGQRVPQLDLLVLHRRAQHPNRVATNLVAGAHRLFQVVVESLLDVHVGCVTKRSAYLTSPTTRSLGSSTCRVYTRILK